MSNLFSILLFFIIFQTNSIFAQCDEYYINKLISGVDDKCYFPEGSPIRFCPRLKGMSINGTAFDVMQWDGISTQYLTLSLNGGIAGTVVLKLKEKELLVNLNGCGGARTYSIFLSIEDQKKELIEKDRELRVRTYQTLEYKVCNVQLLQNTIDELKNLNFPDDSENSKLIKVVTTKLEKEKERLDNENIKTINIFLASGKPDSAAYLYNTLFKSDISLEKNIQSEINKLFTTEDTIEFDKSVMANIISAHMTRFQSLSPGDSYQLLLDQNRNLYITSKDFKRLIGSEPNFAKIGMSQFSFPGSFSSELYVKEDSTLSTDKDSLVILYVSHKIRNRNIYFRQKDGVYFIGDLASPRSSILAEMPIIKTDKLEKTEIEQALKFDKKLTVNGFVVSNKTSYVTINTDKAKNWNARKIFKVLTSPIWGPFYLYFFVLGDY